MFGLAAAALVLLWVLSVYWRPLRADVVRLGEPAREAHILVRDGALLVSGLRSVKPYPIYFATHVDRFTWEAFSFRIRVRDIPNVYLVDSEKNRRQVLKLARVTSVKVPCWMLVAILASVSLLVSIRWRARRRRRASRGMCIQCGYDLRGNISGVCPECGCATGGVQKTSDTELTRAGR
jgi:hypothetical protein